MKNKDFSVSIAIFGHIHYCVQAASEEAAIEKAWEEFHKGTEPDDTEWETGYPCHTGWAVVTVGGGE